MTAPIPKTKWSVVVGEVNAILAGATRYLSTNDIQFRRLLRDAESSVKDDPAEGHSAIACVLQLVGDVDGARYHIDNALQLDSGSPVYLANKLSILVNSGLFLEAQALFDVAADPEKGQFTRAWPIGYVCGAFQSMCRLLHKARAMELQLDEVDTATAQDAGQLLARLGVSDKDVSSVLDVAGAVLRENKLFYYGSVPHVVVFDDPDRSSFLSVTYEVGVSGEEAHALYMSVVEKLATSIEPKTQVVSVGFREALLKRERSAA